MLNYILRRLLLAIPTLLGITLVTFFIINLAPGDPAQFQTQGMMDKNASTRIYEQLKKYYGLDKPIGVRYVSWLGRLVKFDYLLFQLWQLGVLCSFCSPEHVGSFAAGLCSYRSGQGFDGIAGGYAPCVS